MTKEEMNTIIKDTWQRKLAERNNIPEDLGETFANWVRQMALNSRSALTDMGSNPNEQQEQQPEDKGNGQPEQKAL